MVFIECFVLFIYWGFFVWAMNFNSPKEQLKLPAHYKLQKDEVGLNWTLQPCRESIDSEASLSFSRFCLPPLHKF